MSRQPGTPSLLRAINDRSALELLLAEGPLTRAELGQRTGLSKVTASQMLARLETRELVQVVGNRSGRRGPNAELYAFVPTAAYAAGVDVGPTEVHAAVADVTGTEVGRVALTVAAADDPVAVVHEAVIRALRRAKAPLARVLSVVIGTPGVVDPSTGDVGFSFDLPAWHAGLREALSRDLRVPVSIENDVNLAAVAEQALGAAEGLADFALMWVSRGLGSAVVLGGRVQRGATGAAGEIGYLPVPGVPLPAQVSHHDKGAFQRLVGADAVCELAREHGLASSSPAAALRAAHVAGSRGTAFLDGLAGRLAYGVAAICAVVDPGLVVLSGEVGLVGGRALCDRITAAVERIAPVRPRLVPTAVPDAPVLRGALLTAVAEARERLLSTTDEE